MRASLASEMPGLSILLASSNRIVVSHIVLVVHEYAVSRVLPSLVREVNSICLWFCQTVSCRLSIEHRACFPSLFSDTRFKGLRL